jgi:hypothetical protein
MIRNLEFDRLAAYLDGELQRIREYTQANPSRETSAWYSQERVLTLLSRLGRADWEPPDLLFASETVLPPWTRLRPVASLISALRSAGREQEAERHRKKVHEFLDKELGDIKERRARRERPRIHHQFTPPPSPATFDLWTEVERAYALLTKGDLDAAERIVRSLLGGQHGPFSRAAVLNDLAGHARHQGLWSKAEEFLMLSISEPLFPQSSVPIFWLAATSDAQKAGAAEVANRWMEVSGTAFCRLEPDQLLWDRFRPATNPWYRKPFVVPFLDSLYVLTAIREGRLPANAR